MGFFDFLGAIEPYSEKPGPVRRLNQRHRVLIQPLAREIAGARVLDLAAHDGRWAYAFAGAGAASVVGIEGRAELIARFAKFPDARLRARVTLREGDIFEGMEAALAAGERYDVVGVLGILYHVMDHFRLFRLVRAFGPRLILVDGDFALAKNAMIQLMRESTSNPLNSIAQLAGQDRALIGIPSAKAMEMMADALGFRCDWLDWSHVPEDQRGSLADYYRAQGKCRASCILRPL
ncbi:MAG: hypothetical protein CVT82_01745 [Alphaproteobacteria bacterium HGW-Alphaproteobacteria-4]|jgi:hypothetical protein|nr:MAG: hypothetical protein CVT82_01745 [Alphaproteobacteria bacterium HGW-Alphaproteobacteria-4]